MYQIERDLKRYYPELGYEWSEATETIEVETGEVISRSYSFLEWQDDYRAILIDAPPEPAPFYHQGETRATAHFLVYQTVFNTVWQGGKELELDGEGVDSAANFKQWKKQRTEFELQRVWLDLEFEHLLWQPVPPPPVFNPVTPPPPDPRYELYLGSKLLRREEDETITIAIPQSVLGIQGNKDEGIYLAEDPDDRSRDIKVGTKTKIVNRPYLRLIKPQGNSDRTLRVSLRGIKSQYLPGSFVPKAFEGPKLVSYRVLPNRKDRLIPPGVAGDFTFPPIDRKNPDAIPLRKSLNWVIRQTER